MATKDIKPDQKIATALQNLKKAQTKLEEAIDHTRTSTKGQKKCWISTVFDYLSHPA